MLLNSFQRKLQKFEVRVRFSFLYLSGDYLISFLLGGIYHNVIHHNAIWCRLTSILSHNFSTVSDCKRWGKKGKSRVVNRIFHVRDLTLWGWVMNRFCIPATFFYPSPRPRLPAQDRSVTATQRESKLTRNVAGLNWWSFLAVESHHAWPLTLKGQMFSTFHPGEAGSGVYEGHTCSRTGCYDRLQPPITPCQVPEDCPPHLPVTDSQWWPRQGIY